MRRSVDPFAPAAKPRRAIPFDFVLDELAALAPTTRPMFGCTAVYLDERIVFVLRKKGGADDGVWVAYDACHEQEVLALLPRLQPIGLFDNSRSWRKLAADSAGFEEDVLRACALLRGGDERLGKLPDARKRSTTRRAPKRARGH
jgi:hypothetical protein